MQGGAMSGYSQSYQVVQRVRDLLMGQTSAGDLVFLNLTAALERDESPCLVVEMVEESSLGQADRVLKNHVQFRVVAVSRATDWQADLDGVAKQAHDLIVRDAALKDLLQGLRRSNTKMGAANSDFPMSFIDRHFIGWFVGESNSLNGD